MSPKCLKRSFVKKKSHIVKIFAYVASRRNEKVKKKYGNRRGERDAVITVGGAFI